MSEELDTLLQESAKQWAKIEELKAQQEKKDRKAISMFCAENAPDDITRVLELLIKRGGLPEHDKEIVVEFKEKYPEKLTVALILEFYDVKDIYKRYLESGGYDNE